MTLPAVLAHRVRRRVELGAAGELAAEARRAGGRGAWDARGNRGAERVLGSAGGTPEGQARLGGGAEAPTAGGKAATVPGGRGARNAGAGGGRGRGVQGKEEGWTARRRRRVRAIWQVGKGGPAKLFEGPGRCAPSLGARMRFGDG